MYQADDTASVGRPTHADRLAFLVDSQAYFEAFADAVARAQRSVFILGWEVDSGIRLGRDGSAGTESPTLSAFLSDVLADRPELQIHVLCWDWSMIYVLERELWPRQKMDRDTHERLHFHLDGEHPVGASHHEKIVVVDDRVAFIGGIDLGRRRWDTRDHAPEDPRRVSPSGNPYRPFHDVQALVSGRAARDLGHRCRERWRRATGTDLPFPEQSSNDPWPESVEPVCLDVPLSLIRTDPAEELFETEAWHTSALVKAEKLIYIENQYLTSQAVRRALTNRLDRAPAPEIIIVTSRESGGWLEQASMDAERARILDCLAAADPGGRVAAWWPDIGDGESPTVHTKLTVVDDRFAYLGSANLSNRSMGLDTEIGLGMDGSVSQPLADAITGLRRELLAEHLDCTPEALAEAEREAGGVIEAVNALRSGDRTLRDLEASDHPLADIVAPIKDLFDPERPAELAELVPGLGGEGKDGSSED
jgi:phosphatidylserine/phosphatidylglycerophosphate/cardiolipin synthase-like enzyme